MSAGTVTLVFDIVMDKWIPVTFVPYAESLFERWWRKNIINASRYTWVVDAPVKKVSVLEDSYSFVLADGFSFPKVETLEQRIERTKQALLNCAKWVAS